MLMERLHVRRWEALAAVEGVWPAVLSRSLLPFRAPSMAFALHT